jgi:5-methylcytosine-specific restriction protein A
MPRKAKVACTHRGCPTLVEAGNGGLCPQHQKKRHSYYDQTRSDKAHTAVYNKSAWKTARKAALQRDLGWCVICKEKPAELVDHIIEIKDGGCAYCLDNLQSLCNSCHNIKTNEVAKARNF